jgi:2-haloacid dehalogenase
MSHSDLSRTRACVFDAYGTLFDVHSAVGRHRSRLGEGADGVSTTWRQKQLEYTWLRSLMGKYRDFGEVTANALDYALEAHSVSDATLREDLLQAYLSLDSYPEVHSVLGELKEREIVTAILSNGSPDMLAAAVSSAGIDHLLDAVISVDEIGVYKPDPRVYAMVPQKFRISPGEVLFHSSNAWDAVGASAYGFRVLWVNRFRQPSEKLGFIPDAEVKTLESSVEYL